LESFEMQNLLILLFLLLLVLLLQSAWIASAQIRKLQPETLHLNHDTHHYFAVHFKDPSAIASSSSSSSSSSSLLWDEQPLSGMPVYELHKKALALADGMDGYELLGQIGELEGHYLYAVDRRIHRQSPPRQAWWWWRWRLTKRNSPNDHDIITLHKRALESRGADDIHWISHQQPRQRKRKRVPAESLPLTFDQLTDRLGMHDPELNAQWHLYNRAVPGADINITGVWAMNITGRGIVTAVIDDGNNCII
jgi:hypothetical protein